MVIFIMCLIVSLFDVTTATRFSYQCDATATCGCSARSPVSLSKIIGGEPVAMRNAWGWMASLRRDEVHSCGASLITPWFAITAAHCVHNISSLTRLSLNFGIRNLSNSGQIRNITKAYVHPLYNVSLFINDIAILLLHERINLSDSNVACICLPTMSHFDSDSPEYPPVDTNLVTIGWGTTDAFVRDPSPILRQTTIEAIARTDDTCLATIHDNVAQFCAGDPNGQEDTCYGDSGGPLMMFKGGQWQLVGITSYGKGCAFMGFAGVYTRIVEFHSFIQDIIRQKDTSIPDGSKDLADGTKPRSNTEIIYPKSLTEILLICLLSFYIKLFHRNY